MSPGKKDSTKEQAFPTQVSEDEKKDLKSDQKKKAFDEGTHDDSLTNEPHATSDDKSKNDKQ